MTAAPPEQRGEAAYIDGGTAEDELRPFVETGDETVAGGPTLRGLPY